MKRKAETTALLRKVCRGRTKAELKAMFALIRTESDAKLMASLTAPTPKKPAKNGDALVSELQHLFKPLLATAAEKGDLLVEHMAATHRRKLTFEARGLADAIRRLRAHFSDAQIRTGARALVEELAALYSKRETVV